jgi:hypothetical protein
MLGGMAAKYHPLFEHLCKAGDGPVELTFDAIEKLVGPLPASATAHSAWWSNEPEGGRHVQAKAWVNAGREVEEVDRAQRRVRFSAARRRGGS